VLFYEYFHGDSGRGVGASHQTGWTGLVAKLLQPRRRAVAADPQPQIGREGQEGPVGQAGPVGQVGQVE